MDQNEKQGNKGPTMSESAQVDTFRRIRHSTLHTSGRDQFVKNILDNNLESAWIKQMAEHNPYDHCD
jgi:hypothetical protein